MKTLGVNKTINIKSISKKKLSYEMYPRKMLLTYKTKTRDIFRA